MNGWMKLGIVLAGYVLALVVSGVAVWLEDQKFSAADNQAMGGMIAGGEMMYGGAVFVLTSLAPTGLALWFLRRNRVLWSALSVAGLAFAIIGLAAVLAIHAGRGVPAVAPLLPLAALLSAVQMFGSPLWVACFALFTVLAPARDLRRRMLVALMVELGIAAYGFMYVLMRARSI